MASFQSIIPPEACTGCGLCANVCSQNAISMRWSPDGFLVPYVDESSCINCGLCVKKCIALEEKNVRGGDDLSEVVSYGAWNRDAGVHEASSSGGCFTAIAEYVLRMGGVVFGVKWQDKSTAVFTSVYRVEDLRKLRGSKYTQAVPGWVYRDVKLALKQGQKVLFSGTPCQVHALKRYLNKDYDNLLTVDIVCHGVPSRLILEKYIKESEQTAGCELDYISFRDKSEGWLDYKVVRHFVNETNVSLCHRDDIYMKLFLCDEALNLACYNCPYAHIPRQGDFSLGDYWGVQKHHADWPLNLGISSFLVNTPKAEKILNELTPALDMREEDFHKIYPGQPVSYSRPEKKVSPMRAHVLGWLKMYSLEKAYVNLQQHALLKGVLVRRTNPLFRLAMFLRRGLNKIKSFRA